MYKWIFNVIFLFSIKSPWALFARELQTIYILAADSALKGINGCYGESYSKDSLHRRTNFSKSFWTCFPNYPQFFFIYQQWRSTFAFFVIGSGCCRCCYWCFFIPSWPCSQNQPPRFCWFCSGRILRVGYCIQWKTQNFLRLENWCYWKACHFGTQIFTLFLW